MFLRFASLFLPAALLAAPASAQETTWAAERVRVGPDSNACGITRPDPPVPRGVVLWLHGGMNAQLTTKGWEAHRMLTRFLEPGSYYLCSPSAYEGAAWTSPKGMEHIEALLDSMAARYPARLDSLIVVGVSDGGLGALRYARFGKRKPLRFVLFSVYPTLAVERPLETYSSYTSTRWDVFQGGRDRLFPAREVFPLLQKWGKANPRVTLHLFPEGEHDFAWYADNAGDRIREIFGGDRILMMNDE